MPNSEARIVGNDEGAVEDGSHGSRGLRLRGLSSMKGYLRMRRLHWMGRSSWRTLWFRAASGSVQIWV